MGFKNGFKGLKTLGNKAYYKQKVAKNSISQLGVPLTFSLDFGVTVTSFYTWSGQLSSSTIADHNGPTHVAIRGATMACAGKGWRCTITVAIAERKRRKWRWWCGIFLMGEKWKIYWKGIRLAFWALKLKEF